MHRRLVLLERQHALERRQFGRPITEHQAAAFRLARVRTRAKRARTMTLRTARRLRAGPDTTAEAAVADPTASETAAYRTRTSMRTLGGWGYSPEFPVEQGMRDAKLEEIEEGISDIMRFVIARSL